LVRLDPLVVSRLTHRLIKRAHRAAHRIELVAVFGVPANAVDLG
jgi:hypothetical protein